jgi:ribosomal protein S18 acetylase RimI-like enzyme
MRADVRISEAPRDEVLARLEEFGGVYARTFGAPGYDEPLEAAQRFQEEQLPRHAGRDGFRCVVARRGETMLGFAYGYTGERGQFWSDWVAGRVPEQITDAWVGGHFEFVELAVDPGEQGHGIGGALHDALLVGLPHERALLSTYRDDRPAPRLYRRRGWELLFEGLDNNSDLYGLKLGQAR